MNVILNSDLCSNEIFLEHIYNLYYNINNSNIDNELIEELIQRDILIYLGIIQSNIMIQPSLKNITLPLRCLNLLILSKKG